jgi:putative DNA-invertase from lambdoid prophage Rac
MNKAAIFLRVSTKDQDHINQRFEIEERVKFDRLDLYKIYEYNQSAYKPQSKQYLNELLIDARKRKYSTLYIWALDRLSRRGMLETLRILEELSDLNIKVVSIKESFVEMITDDKYGMKELIAGVFGWIAKFQSDRASERIKAAKKRERAQGKTLGRPKGSKDKKTRAKLGYFGNKNQIKKIKESSKA